MNSKKSVLILLSVFALLTTAVTFVFASNGREGEGTIVIANRASSDLTLIDVATDAPTQLAMPDGTNPAEPMYAVYKEDKLFVGDRANNRVVVFDKNDWSVLGEVPTDGGVFHMWAQPDGDQLWVNNDVDNTITVINTSSMSVIETVALPEDLLMANGKPHDVILSTSSAYVTMLGIMGEGDAVIQYSLSDFSEQARATVGRDPHVTIAPNGTELYVASQLSNELKVLDADSLEEIATIAVPAAHGIDISADGSIVYLTNIAGGGVDALYAVDTETNTLTSEEITDAPYAVPHNIVLTGSNDKLYLTHSGATSDKVTVYTISESDPQPIYSTEVTVGLNPFGLEFVPSGAATSVGLTLTDANTVSHFLATFVVIIAVALCALWYANKKRQTA